MSEVKGWTRTQEQALLTGQRQILDLIARGHPLSHVLDCLCRVIEATIPSALCSVLLLGSDGRRVRHAAAPRLPTAYCIAIDNEPIGPRAGSCGTAAFLRTPIIVEDVRTDPLWEDYRAVAVQYGLLACASVPILSPDQVTLGTFAIYHEQAGPFSAQELELLFAFKDLALIAIQNAERCHAIERLQREESLSLLAGGVAHDYNNLLTVITGNLELLAADLPHEGAAQESVRDINTALDSARSLTRQLLSFTGRIRNEPRETNLNTVLGEMARLLGVTISKNVRFELDLEPELPLIIADPGQLQQVTLNLVTNAAEALGEDPGVIRIRTKTTDVEAHSGGRPHLDLSPGTYIILEVEDSGPGMQPEVSARMFEPFFTTKDTGKGLGLSVIQGIVRAHEAKLDVESELGRGTKFSIYFPLRDGVATPTSSVQTRATDQSDASRLILLADDEPLIRRVVAGMLERLGHRVIQADNGHVALALLEKHIDQKPLVLMEMQMPIMGGVEAMAKMRELFPGTEVLLMSAAGIPFGQGSGARPAAHVLQKPFTLEALEHALKQTRLVLQKRL